MRTNDKSKLGRPGRPRKLGERVPLGLRVTRNIKAKLDSAAMESGRSQSQEAELRLEQSFKTRDYLLDALDLAYGPELTALVLAMVKAMQLSGTRSIFMSEQREGGMDKWMLHPYAFDQAAKAATTILEAFRPAGDLVVPSEQEALHALPEGAMEQVGEGFAGTILAATTDTSHHWHHEDWAEAIRDRLVRSGVQIQIKPEKTADPCKRAAKSKK